MKATVRTAVATGLATGLALAALLTGCGTEDDAEPTSASDTSSTSTAPAPTEPTDGPTEPTTADTSAAPTTPAVPAGTPECADVWKAEGRLPGRYRGCVEDGALVKADLLGCESGQAIVRYADRFYAVAGGTIHEVTSPLIDDPDYTETVAGCRA